MLAHAFGGQSALVVVDTWLEHCHAGSTSSCLRTTM